MTKVAYLFGTLDLQSTCDKWVAAAHYGKPSLTLRPGAGAPAPATGLRPSTVDELGAGGTQFSVFLL